MRNPIQFITNLEERYKNKITVLHFLHFLIYIFDKKSRKLNELPSLANNSFLRYFSFSSLYFAQGIPQGLVFYALPAWLASHDYTPTEIAKYVAIVTLPWSFKIVAAPIMDRFTYLPMGKRRLWLLLGQMGLMGGLLYMAGISQPESHLGHLMIIGFVLSVFGILQDISIDSLAIDVLPVDQQARANGLMWGAKVVGISSTVALTGWLFDAKGFSFTLLCFGSIVMLIMLIPMFVKERSMEKRLPWSNGEASEINIKAKITSWRLMIKQLIKVFFLPASLMMGIFAFTTSLGRGFFDSIMPVITVQDLGWSDEYYSKVFGSTSLIIGLMAMFLGGAMLDLWGKLRMMTVFAWLIIPVSIAMALLKPMWTNDWTLIMYMFIIKVLDVFMTIGVFAVAMQLSWKPIAATQFTLYMAIANLGLSLGAWLIGQLKLHFDWQILFVIYVIPVAMALVALRFVNLKKHQETIDKW